MSINRWIGVGRLVKDVDLRYTPGGDAVANFAVAVNRPFKNKHGENEADFINCVIWRKPAENLAKYMKKGSQVGVDGRLQSSTYQDKDDKTVFVTEVAADSVQFLEPKGSQSKPKTDGQASEALHNKPKDAEAVDISDDDLPF